MTDIAANLGQQRLAGSKARHRHRWTRTVDWQDTAAGTGPGWARACRCGAVEDVAKSRKARNSRTKGNRRELELARLLGGEKVGHFGGPEDVRVGMFNVQSKVRAGSAFPGWQWDELAKLPRTGGRVPILIVTDSPGKGIRRRAIAVVTLDDWRALHGEETP